LIVSKLCTGVVFVFDLTFEDCARATIAARPQCAIVNYWPQVIATIVIAFVAQFINRRAQQAVERVVNREGDQRELARLLGRAVRIGMIVLEVVVVLALFNATAIVATFVASLGVTGLLLAFALQDITKNFAAGVLLLLLRPFRLDDRIKIKEFEGQVTDVSLRATSLRTSDGVEVLVPNADAYASPITNFTRYRKRRHQLVLNLPLAAPLEATRQQLEQALRALPSIEQEPAPDVVATGMGSDVVTLEAHFWLPATAPDAAARVSAVIEHLRPIVEQASAQPEETAPSM
jgi:small-conductance mechanosensitive channel